MAIVRLLVMVAYLHTQPMIMTSCNSFEYFSKVAATNVPIHADRGPPGDRLYPCLNYNTQKVEK